MTFPYYHDNRKTTLENIPFVIRAIGIPSSDMVNEHYVFNLFTISKTTSVYVTIIDGEFIIKGNASDHHLNSVPYKKIKALRAHMKSNPNEYFKLLKSHISIEKFKL